MPTARSCRTCALYDLDAVKDRAGRVRKNWVAKCGWETDAIAESVHVTIVRSFGPGRTLHGGYMPPDGGANCPCWKGRPPVAKGRTPKTETLVTQPAPQYD